MWHGLLLGRGGTVTTSPSGVDPDPSKHQAAFFLPKVVRFSNHKADPISAYPIGTDGKQFWATGSWSHTVEVQGGKPFDQKGFWSAIVVNDGTGRMEMQTYNA